MREGAASSSRWGPEHRSQIKPHAGVALSQPQRKDAASHRPGCDGWLWGHQLQEQTRSAAYNLFPTLFLSLILSREHPTRQHPQASVLMFASPPA